MALKNIPAHFLAISPRETRQNADFWTIWTKYRFEVSPQKSPSKWKVLKK